MRTIDTAVAEEFIVGIVTETGGLDLGLATFQVAMSTSASAVPATGWADADDVEIDGATARVALLVTAATPKITHGYLWTKTVDRNETIPRCCKNESITIL